MDKIEDFIEEKEYSIAFLEKVNYEQPNEYLQVIDMFANGECVGYIIFGINSKNNKIIGIEKVMKAYQEIHRNIKGYIRTKMIIKIIHVEEKNVILVKIIP